MTAPWRRTGNRSVYSKNSHSIVASFPRKKENLCSVLVSVVRIFLLVIAFNSKTRGTKRPIIGCRFHTYTLCRYNFLIAPPTVLSCCTFILIMPNQRVIVDVPVKTSASTKTSTSTANSSKERPALLRRRSTRRTKQQRRSSMELLASAMSSANIDDYIGVCLRKSRRMSNHMMTRRSSVSSSSTGAQRSRRRSTIASVQEEDDEDDKTDCSSV